jgi:hypothetical protein
LNSRYLMKPQRRRRKREPSWVKSRVVVAQSVGHPPEIQTIGRAADEAFERKSSLTVTAVA